MPHGICKFYNYTRVSITPFKENEKQSHHKLCGNKEIAYFIITPCRELVNVKKIWVHLDEATHLILLPETLVGIHVV